MKIRIRKLLFLILLMNYTHGQISCKQFDEIVEDIKKSEELEEFTKKHNIKRASFNISTFLYPFCVSAKLLSSVELSDFEKEYCNKEQGLFETTYIEEKCIEENYKKKKSSFILYFSNCVENQIIVEIRNKKIYSEYLIFLYKKTGEIFEKKDSTIVFFN